MCFYPKVCKLGPDDCVNLNQLVMGTHLCVWELMSVSMPKITENLLCANCFYSASEVNAVWIL